MKAQRSAYPYHKTKAVFQFLRIPLWCRKRSETRTLTTAADSAKSRKATKQLRNILTLEIMNSILLPSSKSLAGPTTKVQMLLVGGLSRLGLSRTLKAGRLQTSATVFNTIRDSGVAVQESETKLMGSSCKTSSSSRSKRKRWKANALIRFYFIKVANRI